MKASRRFVFGWLSIGLSVLFVAAGSVGQAADPAHLGVGNWIEKNIPLYMEAARMPGFSIAVVDDGVTIYSEGFGLRDTQKNLPATPDTLLSLIHI